MLFLHYNWHIFTFAAAKTVNYLSHSFHIKLTLNSRQFLHLQHCTISPNYRLSFSAPSRFTVLFHDTINFSSLFFLLFMSAPGQAVFVFDLFLSFLFVPPFITFKSHLPPPAWPYSDSFFSKIHVLLLFFSLALLNSCAISALFFFCSLKFAYNISFIFL